MLHRSFKPAKCKTSLKLAMSRLKLMKNKKLVQINQMKRELSQLLETGQDRTARIRVEHVIREEKMVAAFDLIEIYCELIAARLPIIESQKSCPIDLKEAVTSVIFASPRCSEIPELQDVRKHFTTKYGKEFITAAIEMRPDCGVGRMLIEKLSTVAPDVQTKTKVLSAVAEEYNIKWDQKAFEEKESKPPDDLLNGPSTFERASVVHADPPQYQAAPNVQVPYGHEQERNYSQQNSRSSLGTGNYASTGTGGTQISPTTSHADARASGRGPARMEVRQSFPRDGNDNFYEGQNWNMEFTDATAAAQAAAESAERASMAARAAAELSRRSSGQYTSDSHKPNFREQDPQRYGASDSPAEHYYRGSSNNSFHEKDPRVQNQQIGRSENEEKAAERFNEDGYRRRSSRAASLRSTNDSVHDVNSASAEIKSPRNSQESSLREKFVKAEKRISSSPGMSIRERTRRESNVELGNHRHDSIKSENYGYHGVEMNRNQSITSSSRSHSHNLSDEYNATGSDHRNIGNESAVDRSFGVDQGKIYKETTKTSMFDDVADDVASDETESDEDGPRFDSELHFDEVDAKSFFPSPGRESPVRSSKHTSIWSPKRAIEESVEKSGFETQMSSQRLSPEHSEYSAKYEKSSEPANIVPAASGLYNVPVFDDEDEPNYEKMKEQTVDFELSPKRGTSRFELTDLLDAVAPLQTPLEEKKDREPQLSANFDTQIPQSSHSESGQELGLGTLPSGFRNKAYRRPPYTENSSGNASSFSDKSPDQSPTVESIPTPVIKKSSINSTASIPAHKEICVSQTASDSESSYSSFMSTPEETKKSRFGPPPRFFDDDDDDFEDDIPKVNSSSKLQLGTRLSRRTKAAPSTSGASILPKNRVEPGTKPVNSASVSDRKPTRDSYSGETSPEPRSHTIKQETSKPIPEPKISRREESFKSQTAQQRTSGESSHTSPQTHSASMRHEEATKGKPEYKTSKREEIMKSQASEQPSSPQRKKVESSGMRHEEATRGKPEFKTSKREESMKSQAAEQPSSPHRKKVESSEPEIKKTSNLTGENSFKRASHVHPKLPDYDDIAAHFQALRMNR